MDPAALLDLEDAAVAQARDWAARAAALPPEAASRRLTRLLQDPQGLAFTVDFVDGVIRPEDSRVAARTLRRLARGPIPALGGPLPILLKLAGMAGAVLPGVVVPAVRRVLRGLLRHLVVDAGAHPLGRTVRRMRGEGFRLNVNLLGEAVLGSGEAARRRQGILALIAHPEVDYVSVKVSAIVPPHPAWAFEETVASVVDELRPLFNAAAAQQPPVFVNLDMEEYRDLALTERVFTALLDEEPLRGLAAGIVLQAYLPDSLAALERLQEWAAARRAQGGAAVKVRIVKGANLPMERVEAELHGWELAVWPTKEQTDAHYKRMLERALRPEHVDALRVGVAGHNLFDVALARLLAARRGVSEAVEFEMLAGMSPEQSRVVLADAGAVRLYLPVVPAREFDVAIAYLVRRLEEAAASSNFLSAASALSTDARLFERERERFTRALHRAAADLAVESPAEPRRLSATGADAASSPSFANAPDRDPALARDRKWAGEVRARIRSSALGEATIEAHRVTDAAALDRVLATAAEAGPVWAARPVAERAALLRAAGTALEEARSELCEVMGAEAQKTLDQADPEVSEAVDFAHWYAGLAETLGEDPHAEPVPVGVTVVTPPWNFPVAIPAGSVLQALAAGSAVILKPAPQARRCGAVLAEALWRAGIPREVLQLADVGEAELGRELLSDARVGRVILTGSHETARLFRSFRHDLALVAETSGKNAIVVTPSADSDLAVRDLVASAFGHDGQKCSAASLAILVGPVARSRRFREQLVDAVRALHPGGTDDARTQVPPLISPAEGPLLRALTTLEPGEAWLVEPRRLDEAGRHWTPGVKVGVAEGSWFHRTECFGPVLGILEARDLEHALRLQNAVAYGLTAGLHSLDGGEVDRWLDGVEAGNVYVNRGITGAIVRRQPFGGWKRSAVGPTAKAGGPHALVWLTDWRARGAEGTLLEHADQADAEAWAAEFGAAVDASGLAAERNALRYRPAAVAIREGDGCAPAELTRVLRAARRTAAPVTLSLSPALDAAADPPLTEELRMLARPPRVETEAEWHAWVSAERPERIRLLGEDRAALLEALDGDPAVAVYAHPVTASARLELLPFLKEQAVSMTAHRFGAPSRLIAERVL